MAFLLFLTTFPPTLIVRKSPEEMCIHATQSASEKHPLTFQVPSFCWMCVTGCRVEASRRGGCEEESIVEGPWWATGGWPPTGSHPTGWRSRGTGRSPAGRTFIRITCFSFHFYIQSSFFRFFAGCTE